MRRALAFFAVALCASLSLVACSGSGGGASASTSNGGASDSGAVDSASSVAVLACAPLADAGDVCSGSDARVALFPAPTDALAAGCRAYLAAESKGTVAAPAANSGPAITAPMNGDVLSLDTWAVFEWAAGSGETGNDQYVVLFRQGCDEIARVVEQGTGWTVDAPSWARMKAVTGAITMTVVWIGADGSKAPVASAPVTFTLGP